MNEDSETIRRTWQQNDIPVILRPKTGKLKVKLPEGRAAMRWLRRPGKHRPNWNKNHFEVPATWLNHLLEMSLQKYKKTYLIQPYNEKEVCAAACQNARGNDCQCSCMGANHGQGEDGGAWFEVNETFKVRWKGSVLAVRLMSI